jgi:hypothetical protein
VSKVFKFVPGQAINKPFTSPSIRCFKTKRDAASIGNAGAIFTTADELRNAMPVATSDLVIIHNSLAEKPVTKFQDRETAARRVFALVENMTAEEVPWSNGKEDIVPTQEQVAAAAEAKAKKEADAKAKAAEKAAKANETAAEKEAKAKAKVAAAEAKAKEAEAKKKAKAEAAAAKKAEKEANKKDGKAGRASSLAGKTLVATKAENGRRPGSHGFRSLQIVIDAGAKGIVFEEYVKKGGRNIDAKWDQEHGALTAS